MIYHLKFYVRFLKYLLTDASLFLKKFYSKYTIIARSKRREIEFVDYLDMPWDDLPGDEVDSEDEGETKMRSTVDDDQMTVLDVGKELVEAVPVKDRFERPMEKEDERHFDPEYKNIQGLHQIIWQYYVEVENLRQRRSDLSNRLKALEQ